MNKSGDATVHLSGDSSVVALAKFKTQVGIGHRITKARQELSVIVDNVAVMQGNDIAITSSQEIAIG